MQLAVTSGAKYNKKVKPTLLGDHALDEDLIRPH